MGTPVRPDVTSTVGGRSWLAKHLPHNTIGASDAPMPPSSLGERILQQLGSIPMSGAQALYSLVHGAVEGGATTAAHTNAAIDAARTGNLPTAAKRAGLAALTAAATIGAPEGEPEEAASASKVVPEITSELRSESNIYATDPARRHYQTLIVRALHPETGERLGHAEVDPTTGEVWRIDTQAPYRRQGIATAMLDHAESTLGKPVFPNKALTDNGSALFQSRATPVVDSLATAAAPRLAKRYAVLTAENPGGRTASEAENLANNLKLEQRIRSLGYKPQPTLGGYPSDAGEQLYENGFYVPGMTREHAMQLGKEFNQESVLTEAGLHYPATNVMRPSLGVEAGDANVFTKLPNGTNFKHNFDWDAAPQPIPQGPSYPAKGAPAVLTRERWRPTPRGVFDRTPGSDTYREPSQLPFVPELGPKSSVDPLAAQIANDPRVEARIREDVARGLPLGGESWYGLLPLRNSYEEMNGPISFNDFNMAGAAGSARTATHNELTNASINLFAKAHGVTPEEARQEFLRRFPGSMRPTFMGMHGGLFARGQEAGAMLPTTPSSGALKIPNYFHDRMLGANGVAIDTHEMRAMAQAMGLPEESVRAAVNTNGPSYMAAMQPYLRVAQDLGLHPDQVQAARWLGGGLATGLKSQPKGDFLQTLEDGLLYTAQQRGMDTSPKGLRNLWQAIAQGNDFFLPYSGEGGFPVK